MSAKPDPTAGEPRGKGFAARQSGPVVRWLDEDPPLAGVGTGTAAARPKRSWLPLIAIGVLVFALGRERLSHLLDSHGPVPGEFVGAWRTTAVPHADRGFTITLDSLWLKLGPDVSLAYPIVGVRQSRAADPVVYTFVYGDSPAVLEMDLLLDPDTTVHLASMPSVRWRKEQP